MKEIDKVPNVLINNAGITGPTASLWEYDLEMWKKVVEINLMGTFHCCKAIVPNMIKNNYGRIVNRRAFKRLISIINGDKKY